MVIDYFVNQRKFIRVKFSKLKVCPKIRTGRECIVYSLAWLDPTSRGGVSISAPYEPALILKAINALRVYRVWPRGLRNLPHRQKLRIIIYLHVRLR